jgi:hypothetical protein
MMRQTLNIKYGPMIAVYGSEKDRTPIIVFPDTPAYRHWHYPRKRDMPWVVRNHNTDEIIETYSPPVKKKPKPITPIKGSWAYPYQK